MRKNLAGLGEPSEQSRRMFLASLALSHLCRHAPLLASSAAERTPDAGNREAKFSSFRTLLTPNEEFFVRNHFPVPKLAQTSRLRVFGRVHSPFETTYAEIARLPSRMLTVTTECAGSALGGVSTATWEGVPLGMLLERAGLGSGVKYIRMVGADQGTEGSQPTMQFARSIPVEKALHPYTIVAFRMNGAVLPVEHGYPCRALVPGWYGMDSVKWLAGIEALDHPDAGFFMTQRYVALRRAAGGFDRRPVTRMLVKSLIIEPLSGAVVGPGQVAIRGVAWAGENRIAQAEISADAGIGWSLATLDKKVRPYTWVPWSYAWSVRTPGAYTIIARATDDQGNSQPIIRDQSRLDAYELNGCHSLKYEVR
jgi:DMSO/TMAO reductase YedYZ molybdopterin-dependent catalytic subunit